MHYLGTTDIPAPEYTSHFVECEDTTRKKRFFYNTSNYHSDYNRPRIELTDDSRSKVDHVTFPNSQRMELEVSLTPARKVLRGFWRHLTERDLDANVRENTGFSKSFGT